MLRIFAAQTAPAPTTPTTPGSTSGPQSYRHVQSTPAPVWRFVHDLAFEPGGFRIVDYADPGIEWMPDVDYDRATRTVTLTFPEPVRGEVVVS